MLTRFRLMAAAAIAAGLAAGVAPQAQQDFVARARAIHDRVLTLDTHNDIDPQNFTFDCNYTMRLTTQVNLPKMKEGGLDVSFSIVYVGQTEPKESHDALQPAGYVFVYRARAAQVDAIQLRTEQ